MIAAVDWPVVLGWSAGGVLVLFGLVVYVVLFTTKGQSVRPCRRPPPETPGAFVLKDGEGSVLATGRMTDSGAAQLNAILRDRWHAEHRWVRDDG